MQLIYRGHAFTYSPVTVPSTVVATSSPRTLYYRGTTYRCQVATLPPSRLPDAINWRFAGLDYRSQQQLRPAH